MTPLKSVIASNQDRGKGETSLMTILNLKQILKTQPLITFFLGLALCVPLRCFALIVYEAIGPEHLPPLFRDIWFACFKKFWTEFFTTKGSFTMVLLAGFLGIMFLIILSVVGALTENAASSFKERWLTILKSGLLTWRFTRFLFLVLTLSSLLLSLMTSSTEALVEASISSKATPEITSPSSRQAGAMIK